MLIAWLLNVTHFFLGRFVLWNILKGMTNISKSEDRLNAKDMIKWS